ncbi:MAG: hypothetical protein R3321_12700, partial [Nitrososphaeraceae archaeon]|nr:hypothetical protein [Nitrososphaeraceae archaeon]
MMIFSIPFIYDVPIFGQLGQILNQYSANARFIFVMGFSISILSAIGLENKRRIVSLEKYINVLIIAILFLGLSTVVIVPRILPLFLQDMRIERIIGFSDYLSRNIIYIASTTLLGLFVLKKFIFGKNKNFYLVLLSGVVFAQTGIMFID